MNTNFQHRMVCMLSVWFGLNIGEIAECTGLSRNAVSAILRRSRNQQECERLREVFVEAGGVFQDEFALLVDLKRYGILR